MPDDVWSCVATWNNASWAEGSPGEVMTSMQSYDRGRTWTPFVDIEPPDMTGPLSSSFGSIVKARDLIFALTLVLTSIGEQHLFIPMTL